MKTTLAMFASALLLSALSASAASGVTLNSVTKNAANGSVTVNYTLSEAAVVTLAFRTNGVQVAGCQPKRLSGDVNRLVSAGAHSATWWPNLDGGDFGLVDDATLKLTAWPKNSPPMYMAVALAVKSGGDNLRFYPCEDALPFAITDEHWKREWLLLRRIYAAGREWRMGSPTQEADRQTGEGVMETAHPVVLTADYYMGVYEFTRTQCHILDGTTYTLLDSHGEDTSVWPLNNMSPNNFRGAMKAGEAYDWPTKGHAVDSAKPLGKLRALVNGQVDFDLPTEAQWEYAARAGMGTRFAIEDESSNSSTNVAWTAACGNSSSPAHCGEGGWPHSVGLLRPNAWGLYDMLGNVGEWTLDWRGHDPDGSLEVDPVGETTGTVRIAKGTGFFWGVTLGRCAARGNGWAPDQARDNHGFRLCAPAVIK